MTRRDDNEFKIAVRDIGQFGFLTLGPYDRVRVIEWLRKLGNLHQEDVEQSRLRNEYVQLLRIMVRGGRLHGPFQHLPPDRDLLTLSEALASCITRQVKGLPKPGPIAPVIAHHSEDGQVYLAAKQMPGGGMFCYMACSPEPLYK